MLTTNEIKLTSLLQTNTVVAPNNGTNAFPKSNADKHCEKYIRINYRCNVNIKNNTNASNILLK